MNFMSCYDASVAWTFKARKQKLNVTMVTK